MKIFKMKNEKINWEKSGLPDPKWFLPLVILIVFLVTLAASALCYGEEYTDDQIVQAIYKAEGGEKAKYPYGIRSVHCATKSECLKICQNTVRNNRKRYQNYGHKLFGSYLEFLASRYCPTTGRNLSKAEKQLNKNWLKNVQYFLAKGK